MQHETSQQFQSGKEKMLHLESLCSQYKEINDIIKDLTERKQHMMREILSLMPTNKVYTESFSVLRVRQILIKTSLEKAREMGYTKTEEVVDKEALKNLFNKGFPVPDAVVSEHVRLTPFLKNEAAETINYN